VTLPRRVREFIHDQKETIKHSLRKPCELRLYKPKTGCRRFKHVAVYTTGFKVEWECVSRSARGGSRGLGSRVMA